MNEVYSVLTAGDVPRASWLLRAMGARPGRLDPQRLSQARFFGADSHRALVSTATTCSFGDLGQEKCYAALERVDGTCEGGKLIATCGQVLVDTNDGAIKAFYRGASARVEGSYLLTFEHEGKTVVRRPTTLEELIVTEGEVVAALEGNRLVSVKSTSTPASTSPSGVKTALLRVIDPTRRTTTPPCAVAAPVSGTTKFRLLAGGRRLLVSQGSPYTKITVCALDTGKVVHTVEAEGSNVVVVDRAGERLFVSGIPIRSSKPAANPSKPEFTGLFEHLVLDLGMGASQRLRTKESIADVPGRDMLLTGDEKTLIVASDHQMTLFGTSPFRALASVDLGVVGAALDSSYNVTPLLHLLPDGKTVLATYGITDVVPATREERQRFNVWVLSSETGELIYRGMSSKRWREDPKAHRGAMVLDAWQPREERVVLMADETGIRSRPLVGVEGDGTGETLPPELATLSDETYWLSASERVFTNAAPPEADPALVQWLTGRLCVASGLIVPTAACAPN